MVNGLEGVQALGQGIDLSVFEVKAHMLAVAKHRGPRLSRVPRRRCEQPPTAAIVAGPKDGDLGLDTAAQLASGSRPRFCELFAVAVEALSTTSEPPLRRFAAVLDPSDGTGET